MDCNPIAIVAGSSFINEQSDISGSRYKDFDLLLYKIVEMLSYNPHRVVSLVLMRHVRNLKELV